MHSIFEYRDYKCLLQDASSGRVYGVFPDSLQEQSSLMRRAMVEGQATAILFFKDLAKAMNLQGASAAHLRTLMLPVKG